jgi:hypothetical protein
VISIDTKKKELLDNFYRDGKLYTQNTIEDLQALADRTGLEIRVAHCSAYCSKHNPIEYRVFCHVTRACEGVVFDSVTTVKTLMERTQTQTGLTVTVDIIDKVYESGRKACAQLKTATKIVCDSILPKWNYTFSPATN